MRCRPGVRFVFAVMSPRLGLARGGVGCQGAVRVVFLEAGYREGNLFLAGRDDSDQGLCGFRAERKLLHGQSSGSSWFTPIQINLSTLVRYNSVRKET